jgi:hypothetical protein
MVAELVGVHGPAVVAAALATATDEPGEVRPTSGPESIKRQDTFGASELFYTKKNGKPYGTLPPMASYVSALIAAGISMAMSGQEEL